MNAPATSHELSVTRLIHASPETVYRTWTQRIEEWWVPRPWTARLIEQDLRTGGRSAIEVQGPEGERFPHDGIFLEVVPNERIVITNAFTDGWQPKGHMDSDCDFPVVNIVTFAPEGDGTRYTARVLHWTGEAVKAHEAMGFHQGWTQVTAQLAELAEGETR
jgi:uncharacterized protein YndB with AHSA1/START domain